MSDRDEASGDEPAYLAQSFDERLGIVRVVGRGFWTEADIDAHFAELGRLIGQVRAKQPDILALVDLSAAPVQSPEVAARITAHTQSIYRAEDRIAIVVRSSLVKMQMKRAVDRANLEVFISPDAALTWLIAYNAPVRVGAGV